MLLATTLFEARSGTLRLNDRNRHTRGDTRCPLCNHEYDDLEHFLLMCDSLKSTRMKIVGLQRPHYEDHEISGESRGGRGPAPPPPRNA